MATIPRVMTVAGSDSGGGAGIQADLKSFAAMGVYGSSVITAITAQNTIGVRGIIEIPEAFIGNQIDAVIVDIGTDAVKTGMLSSTAIVRTVVDKIEEYGLDTVVVDPVMVAKGGDRLLTEDASTTLRDLLLPKATVLTPNIPEAEVLTGRQISDISDSKRAAQDLVNMGAVSVVVKGGHLEGSATDIFYDGNEFIEFSEERISTSNTHGTGCTFASAIAAVLAKGGQPVEAVCTAKSYVTEAIRNGLSIGGGHGPLNHFYHMKSV